MGYIVHGVTKSQTWLSDFHFHFLLKAFSKLLKTSLLLPSLLPYPYCSGLLVSQRPPLSPALLMVSPMNLAYFRAFALTVGSACLSLRLFVGLISSLHSDFASNASLIHWLPWPPQRTALCWNVLPSAPPWCSSPSLILLWWPNSLLEHSGSDQRLLICCPVLYALF